MGTAAFDRLWEDGSQKKAGDALDALWDGAPKHDFHAEFKSGKLAKRMARENANDADAADAATPSYGAQVAGGLASLAKDIPGAEAVQAGARALVRGQSYRDALNDIRGAENDAPTAVRRLNRVAGATVAAAAMPSTLAPARAAAAYGAAQGALQANPNAGLKDRATDAAIGGVVGGAVGKLGDAVTNALRAKFAPSLAKNMLQRRAAMRSADTFNYDKAASEGWVNGGTSADVQNALNHPTVAPFAERIRTSPEWQGADDATVLREAYKLLSDRQSALGKGLATTDDIANGTRLNAEEVTAAKKVMQNAADGIMPSFRAANEAHATAMGEQEALRRGSLLARVLARGTQVGEKGLTRTSPEAFRASVPRMTTEEAKAALEGLLSRTGDYVRGGALTVNPIKGFGIPQVAAKTARITPFLQMLEERTGGAPLKVQSLRALIAGEGHPDYDTSP
jgi:hypothetical protein